MNNDRTLYEILGFSKNGYNENGEKVSFENIERAKNRLLYGDMGEDSVPFWMRDDIYNAYSVLSNPRTRREYDESLLVNDVSLSDDTNNMEITSNEYEDISSNFSGDVEYDDAVVDLNDYYSMMGQEGKNQELNQSTTSGEETSEIVENDEETLETVESDEETIETVENDEETIETVENDEETIETVENDEETIEETPVVEEPTVVEDEATKSDDYIIPIEEKLKKEKEDKPKKELSKTKKMLIYGGSIAILGIPGALIAHYAIKKASGKKFKLHPNKNKKISEIKTEETRLINEYNDTVNKEINTLLSKQNSNYNLEISKIRYKNQVELLKKRIDLKKNENVKRGGLLKYKLECVALNNQLERAEQRLEAIDKKIDEYNKTGKVKNLLSSTLNEKLYETDAQIKEETKENQIYIKKLNVKKTSLQKSRDLSVNGLKLTRNAIGKVQDGFVRAFDNIRSVKEIFTPYDEISFYEPEQQESQRIR